MKTVYETITCPTTAHTDVIDITERTMQFVEASGIREGLFNASVPGSTASITTIEYESGVVKDLKRVIEELVPSDRTYDHDAFFRQSRISLFRFPSK